MAMRIVGVGRGNVDFFGTVPRYPAAGQRAHLIAYSKQGGGQVPTALATAASFGAQAAFIGAVAEDGDFGRFILEGLREAGVDTSRAITVPGAHSAFSVIVLDRESGSRTVFAAEGDVPPLEPTQIDAAFLEGAQVLLVDGTEPRAQIAAAEAARERDVQVLLDASQLTEGMGELVALSNVTIANERFLSDIAPRGEVEDSLLELARMGPERAVVTLGASGSLGLEGNALVRQPVHPVKIVDTTGAGDVYRGAFAFALARGDSLARCMQIASVAAGLSCRAIGTRAGIPELEEVLAACGLQDG